MILGVIGTDIARMKVGIRKALITAGGWGTKFLPITKSQPKEMLPLLNKPLIQYCVEEAIACGAELLVIVTAFGKRAIEDYFDRHFELETMLREKGETKLLAEVHRSSNMVDIGYIRQKGQLGLGHAVYTARKIIGYESFLLLLPDDVLEQRELVVRKMIEIHDTYGANVVAVKRVPRNEVIRYGIIDCRQVAPRIYQVVDLVEKPQPEAAPSDLAIMGRYVLMPGIFEALQETPPGKNGEIQLTDALKRLLLQQPLYAYEFDGERWDAGTLSGWLETTVALALKDPDIGPKIKRYLQTLNQSLTR
jgi:UTP--glucose-1-phosphate uridylyltransferase